MATLVTRYTYLCSFNSHMWQMFLVLYLFSNTAVNSVVIVRNSKEAEVDTK